MVGRYSDLAEARGYNPTHGHSVIPTFSATCIPYTVVELQSHARALRHSDQKGYQPMNYTTLLQSHARAIRHSDSCNHRSFGDAEIVTIPRTGNPSFRLLQPSFFRRCGDCYNPTHGQSVIPTNWRQKPLETSLYGYNPTLGQSVIPTIGSDIASDEQQCYNPTHGQSVIPTHGSAQPLRGDVS